MLFARIAGVPAAMDVGKIRNAAGPTFRENEALKLARSCLSRSMLR